MFITDLAFARRLLDYDQHISAYEVDLSQDADRKEMKEILQDHLGDGWEVQTREEQNELIYKIFRSEKWFTYAILALVLLISAFNIFGSLIMLVLDKKKDISVLKSMGADRSIIKKIFLWQGSYISLLGGGVGLLLGVITVVLQKKYGLLKLEQSIVEFYPVDLRLPDIMVTFLTILLLGYLISLYPARKAGNASIEQLN